MIRSLLSSYDCRHCLRRYHTIVVIVRYDHRPTTMTKDNNNDGKDNPLREREDSVVADTRKIIAVLTLSKPKREREVSAAC